MDIDFQKLSDEALEQLMVAAGDEQLRRSRVAMIPGQIISLKQQYIDGGGDLSELIDIIQPDD